MNLEEIKEGLRANKRIYWSSTDYLLEYNSHQKEYFIKHLLTGHQLCLVWEDGKTLNGKEKDFFIREPNF